MSRRAVLLLISILYIMIIFVLGQNINLLKNKFRREKEVPGYKEYIEYVAWENMMLIENPDCKDPKILIDVSEKTLYILDGNKLINKYPVATGKSSTPTPLGSWKVVNKARWGGVLGPGGWDLTCLGANMAFMVPVVLILSAPALPAVVFECLTGM